MSDYLETPRNTLSTDCVFKTTYGYILEEFRTHLDVMKLHGPKRYLEDGGERFTQIFLDSANDRLRMYGSAKDLAENVEAYRQFADCHRYYRTDNDPYFTSVIVYQSFRGERYITKLDLLIILQNMVLKLIPEAKSPEIRLAINSALKGHEMRHFTFMEFAKFDERVFEDMEKDVLDIRNSFIATPEDVRVMERHLANGCFNKIYARYPPTDTSKEDDRAAINSIKLYYKRLSPKNRTEQMVLFLNKTLVMKHLLFIIEKHPNMFFPLSNTYYTNKGPITVRVFEDRDKQFVIKAELFHSLGSISGKRSKYQEEPHLFGTISLEEVEKIYGGRVERIEFIHTPILRTKHRAVPVRGHLPMEFGQLAIDALFDLIRSLIFGSRVFERNRKPSWKDVQGIFSELPGVFKFECKVPYFIRDGMLKQLLVNFDSVMKMTEYSKIKEIREVRNEGFELEDLKKELAHLGLTHTFENIPDHVEVVYEHVDKNKKEKFLRTCDMYDAVEMCQMICLFEKVPKIRQFLHNQGGCHRVIGLHCDLCFAENQSESDTQTSSSAEIHPECPIPNHVIADSVHTATVFHTPRSYSEYEECYLDDGELELNISRAKLEEAQRRLADKEKELVEVKKDYRKVVEEKKMKSEEKQKEIENLKKKIERMAPSQENADLKAQFSELEAERDQLKEAISKQELVAQRAQTKLTTKITQLEVEANGKKKTQKALQDRVDGQSLENQKLLEINLELKKELAENVAKQELVLKELKEGKEQIEALKQNVPEEKLKEVEQINESNLAKLSEKEQQLSKLKTEFDQFRISNSKKILDLEKKLQELKYDSEKDIRQKKKKIDELKATIRELEDELKEIKKENKEEMKEKRKEIDRLKGEIKNAPPIMDPREKEVLNTKITELEGEIRHQKEQHSRQESSFRESQSELFTRISCLERGLTQEIQNRRNVEFNLRNALISNRHLHFTNARLGQENLTTGNAIRETLHKFNNLSFSYTH